MPSLPKHNAAKGKQLTILEEEMLEMAALIEVQNASAKYMHPSSQQQEEIDARSVYVGNVDWYATAEEIEDHFDECGKIVRVTIPVDKFTGRQKNFAYVQFETVECVELALVLSGTTFRNRKIFVTAKRTNKPGMGPSHSRIPVHKENQFSTKPHSRSRRNYGFKYVSINGAAPIKELSTNRFQPY